jgi:ComF family protein
MSFFYFLFDIIFPSKCVCCASPVSLSDRNLCFSCFKKIEYIKDECPVCSGVIEDNSCVICSGRKFYPVRHISLVDYSNEVRELLHGIKYNGLKRAVKILSEIAVVWPGLAGVNCDIITSVPMNSNKIWKRGFNQCELIAKSISKEIKAPYMNILLEKNDAGKQNELGYRDRFLNVIGRYKVKSKKIFQDKTVLLIDDIFTSGATVNECARILLKNGAFQVFSLSIARTKIKRLEIF